MSARRRIRSAAKGAATGGVAPELPSDVDYHADLGSQTESMQIATVRNDAISTGSESQSMAVSLMTQAVSLGQESASMGASVVGTATADTGSESSSMGASVVSSRTSPTGQQSESFAGTATVVATAYATTVTAVSLGGSVDWTSPTNAQGAFNDTEAAITAASSVGAGATMNDDLRATVFALSATPPTGYTRTKVEVIIRHRWDLTVGALSTATFAVTLRSSLGVSLGTIVSRAQGSGDQATLLTETYNVTSLTTGLTNAQVAGLQVWCEADANLLLATGGNASWQVDGIHLQVTYNAGSVS